VDLIGLVVETERVHDEVDAESQGLLALDLAAGDDIVLPLPVAIAGPGAAKVILAVDDRGPASQLHRLDVGSAMTRPTGTRRR
jgi:hypothetical protein